MTKTHRTYISDRPGCQEHDVTGCQDINCRAKVLGLSVSQYKAWIVVPASMTLNAHRKSH